MSALMVGAGLTVAANATYFAIRRIPRSQWKALAWVSTFTFFFWQWGAWSLGQSWIGWTLSAAIACAVAVAVGRVAERWFVRIGLFVISATLLATMTGLIVLDLINAPEETLTVPATPELGAPVQTPDVLLIVFDAYARADILGAEYGFDNRPFLQELEDLGFSVSESSNANYTMTHGSISSLLTMNYLESSSGYINNSDLDVFESMVSGLNPTVELFQDAGYTYVHASADNWVNYCSGVEDICLPGPLLDQTAFTLLTKTPIGPLLYPISGDPTTALDRVRIEQLRDWRAFSATLGEQPRFVYMHLGLPHPPVFLDAECRLRVEPSFAGQRLNDLQMSDTEVETRKAAYVEQVKCANDTIRQFVDQLNGDEVVIITSDHGPDSHGLPIGNQADWTPQRIFERMGTFTAMRVPEGCAATDDPDLQLVNVFRGVFTCLYDTSELPPLESRYYGVGFGGPIVNLEDPDAAG